MPAEYDIPTISAVFSNLTTEWRNLPAFSTVVSTATERLLQLLGDADVVCSACCNLEPLVRQQLSQLSQPGLLALLRSPQLQACSENSVLMMVSNWIECAEAGSDSTTGAALQEVVAFLRLTQLTSTFLYDILPQLPWVTVTCAQRESLLRFVAAQGAAVKGAGSHSRAQQHLIDCGEALGPEAWYAPQSRARPHTAPPPGLSIDVRVTRQQLAVSLKQGCSGGSWWRSPQRFLNGFTVQVVLMPTKRDGRHFKSLGLDVAVMEGATRLSFKAAELMSGCIQQMQILNFVHSTESREVCVLVVASTFEALSDIQAWGTVLLGGMLHKACPFESCR